jgi:hypothetical protein
MVAFFLEDSVFSGHYSLNWYFIIQGDSNMTGTDLCVNKPQSVPVIFESPCTLLQHASKGNAVLFLLCSTRTEET